jgi:nitrate/TMAO reductase-like tetraheme cytochrome c subunit
MLDRELRGPSTKTKRIIIIASLAIMLLGISAVVVMHYTSQPNFCASCHQINPSVVSWSVGPHKDVTCLKCHADPGTIGYVKRKVAGLNEVYLQVTNQIPDKIEAKIIPAACIYCHTGSSEFPNEKNLLLTTGELAPMFPHTEMLQNNTSCLTCHQNVGHSKTTQQ